MRPSLSRVRLAVATLALLGAAARAAAGLTTGGDRPATWADLEIAPAEAAGWEAAGWSATAYDLALGTARETPINRWTDFPRTGLPAAPYGQLGTVYRFQWTASMTLDDSEHHLTVPVRSPWGAGGAGTMATVFTNVPAKPGPVYSFGRLERVLPAGLSGAAIGFRIVGRTTGGPLAADPPPHGPKPLLVKGGERPGREWDLIDSRGLEFQGFWIRTFEATWPPSRLYGSLVWSRSLHPGVTAMQAFRSMSATNATFVAWNAEEQSWFGGLVGDLIIADQGCCPGPRELVLYRIADGATRWADTYVDDVALVKPGVLEYWSLGGLGGAPAARGKDHSLRFERIDLDLNAMTVKRLGKTKIVPSK